MSGGGSNGAWEIGVLYGFAHQGNPEDFYYDVVTGISAGSINTAALAPWAPEDFVAATEFISETWNGLTNADIWNYQPDIPPVEGEGPKYELGLRGFLEYPGAVSDSPALKTISDILAEFPEGYKRDIRVTAANANTGEYHQFTNANTPYSDLPRAAMSSASIPGIFPPMVWQDTVYMDGGTIWNLNVDGAIQACMDKGYAQNEIVIDMLSCYYRVVDTEPAVSKSALQNFLESRAVGKFYSSSRDITSMMAAYPNVNYRYFIMNSDTALGLDEINFNASATWHLQVTGQADAAAAMAAGPGVGSKALKDWFDNVDNVQARHTDFMQFYRQAIGQI